MGLLDDGGYVGPNYKTSIESFNTLNGQMTWNAGSYRTVSLGTLSQDDFVVVLFAHTDITDRTMTLGTSGYTTIADLYANDSYDTNMGLFYKVMGSTPDTEVRMTIPTSTSTGVYIIWIFRGVDTTTPMDTTAQTLTVTNTNKPNPPDITTVTKGAVVLTAGAGAFNNNDPNIYAYGDLRSSIGNSTLYPTYASVSAGMSIYNLTGWEAGATVSPSTYYTWTDAVENSAAAVTLALRPASTNRQTGIRSLRGLNYVS